MRDRKALQLATSHELGQNFARAFDIKFTDASGAERLAWTTSWGSSTRMMGGAIMAHGDERGMRFPPRIAPAQVVVVVVREDAETAERAARLGSALADRGVRVKVDTATHVGFGRRATDWELKGVPIRLDLGPRDLAAGVVSVFRRDTNESSTVPLDDAVARVDDLLPRIQDELYEQALRFRDASVVDVTTVAEAAEAGNAGVARIPWSVLGPEGERALLERGVSVRCLQREDGTTPESDDEPGGRGDRRAGVLSASIRRGRRRARGGGRRTRR